MAIYQRNGLWHWRKMVDGVTLSRSTKTDDKALATKIARKWDHEAVQQIKVDGERPVLLHDAIEDFLADRMHNKGYVSAAGYMKKWKSALPNVYIKTLHKHQVQKVVTDQIKLGLAHNTVSVFVMYWNALVNHCERKGLSPGPKLDRIKQSPTRFRVITNEEEALLLAATSPAKKLSDCQPTYLGIYQGIHNHS